MTRLEVCRACDQCSSQSPLKCRLITKKTMTGEVECPRVLMAMIFGREDRPCPHPDQQQRDRFANAEVPKASNNRPKREPMAAVNAKLRDKFKNSPHTRRHALSATPKMTFKDTAPTKDKIG